MMLKIILYVLLSIVLLIFVWFTVKFKSKPYQTIKLFYLDKKNEDLEVYPNFGFWLFSGLGGSGKTVAMVEYAYRMKKLYPKLWVASGIKSLTFADEIIWQWEDVIQVRNPNGDKYGVLILLDEIQLTLSSTSWKNAPENLLEYVSQQRKLYKHIIASSQVFQRVNIKLREQTNYIIDCRNIAKRWIFISAFNTMTYSINGDKKDEGRKDRKRVWTYNFIATDEIRNLYDTYETQVSLN